MNVQPPHPSTRPRSPRSRASLWPGLLRLAMLMTLCVGAAACSDPLAARFQRQLSINNANFGEDGRLFVRIDSGRVVATTPGEDAFELTLRSSVPAPVLTLDNGTLAPQPVRVRLANTLPGLRASARREPLPAGARRDPRCAERDPPWSLVLDPPPVLGDDDEPRTLDLLPEPCSRLVVRLEPPVERGSLRVLISGPARGSEAWVGDLLDAARAIDADWVQFLGDPTRDGLPAQYTTFLQRVEAGGIPFHVVPGRGDRDGSDAFQDRFGPTDAVTSVGSYRWLNLDTSESRIIDDQRALLLAVAGDDRPGVAFMSVPPLDPVRDERDGFARRSVAVRLLETLATRGFLHVFSAPQRTSGERDLGRVRVLTTGGAGAPDGREAVLLTLPQPTSILPRCDQPTDCADGERCVTGTCLERCDTLTACGDDHLCRPGGWCSPRCAEDADCAGVAERCDAGSCVVERQVRVERIFF